VALVKVGGVQPDRMLPNRVLIARYAGRHLRLWALLRVGLSGAFLLAGTDPLRVTPLTVCAVVLLCTAVSVLELHVRHERALLGNLGVDSFALGVLLLVPPLAGELVVRALGTLRA
jgi:hypothetical protein